MKIVFLGTPKFGADILNGLLDAGREIVAVVCQPDRRGNRNKTEACQVKRVAEQRNLKVFQFEKIDRQVGAVYCGNISGTAAA